MQVYPYRDVNTNKDLEETRDDPGERQESGVLDPKPELGGKELHHLTEHQDFLGVKTFENLFANERAQNQTYFKKIPMYSAEPNIPIWKSSTSMSSLIY